jgi:hypothetical protein
MFISSVLVRDLFKAVASWLNGMQVLDPNYKNAYAENNWDVAYYEEGMERLRAIVSMMNLFMSSSLMIILTV